MKPCPYCLEEVRDDAVKCRYCGSSLSGGAVPADSRSPKFDLEPNQILLVLDRGFLYFGKFVLGVVVIIIAFGTAYFGFDLNKAREDVEQSKKQIQQSIDEVRKSLVTLQDEQKSIQSTMASVTATAADAEKLLKEVHAKADELLNTAQREAGQIHILYAGVSTAPANGPNSAASVQPTRFFTVTEIAALYHFPVEQNGAGQTIGLIELGGGFRESDLNAYFAKRKLPPPSVVAVSVDGARNQPTGSPNSADGQVMADIEVTGSVVPGARIVVFFGPNTNAGFVDAVAAAAHDNTHKPSVISISWGGSESSWNTPGRLALDAALETAAKLGITVVVAAGDGGVTDGAEDGRPHVDFPASSPWVLSVGGTSLLAKGADIQSEKVWNSSGGGISDVFAVPDWQRDANSLVRKDGSHGRGIPDVAAVADPATGYEILVDGHWVVIGGTSLATPLWAGLIARLNQGLGRNLGYFNPILFEQIGPAGILNAITEGNNGSSTVPGFAAGKGWNAAAGWGTPDGTRLLNWLRGQSAGK